MNRFEVYANASRRVPSEDLQLDSFHSMASALPDSGQLSAANTVAALELALLYNGQDGGHMPGSGVAELPEGQYVFSTSDWQIMETEKYHGQPMPASSYDSIMSDSTFASGHTMTSSDIFEGIDFPWSPELLPAYEDRSFMNVASVCQAHESVRVPVENGGPVYVEESVANTGMDVLLPAVSRSARTLPCFVRLVCACYRFRSKGLSKKGINGKRKRSNESKKYPCEIRISKQILKDGKYTKEKVWLGTYATPAQRGRALDVGKYFLCTKKKKTFSDPNSEAILSAFKHHLQALPLTELVEIVIKLAKYYGEKGSLPQNLNDL